VLFLCRRCGFARDTSSAAAASSAASSSSSRRRSRRGSRASTSIYCWCRSMSLWFRSVRVSCNMVQCTTEIRFSECQRYHQNPKHKQKHRIETQPKTSDTITHSVRAGSKDPGIEQLLCKGRALVVDSEQMLSWCSRVATGFGALRRGYVPGLVK